MADKSGAAVDLEELKDIMDNDMDLVRECFKEFIQDWPVLYVALKTAIMEKNARSLEETAHRLKGSLRYLAAGTAAAAAHDLEEMGRAQDLEQAQAVLETLKDKCQAVVGFIKDQAD